MVLECFAQISMATLAFCILGSVLTDNVGPRTPSLPFCVPVGAALHCTAATATFPGFPWDPTRNCRLSLEYRGLGNTHQPSCHGWDLSWEVPGRVMLSSQKVDRQGPLSDFADAIYGGGLFSGPSYLWVFPCGTLQAWCSPPGQGLFIGHFLDSDNTRQLAVSSCLAGPASRTRVSRPQPEPQVFPLCMQGLQLPQGLGSHSSVGEGRDRQVSQSAVCTSWSQ